ncbi:MAG: hypothetical protein WBX81_10635 [Nitrososphaeraceae archaeon]
MLAQIILRFKGFVAEVAAIGSRKIWIKLGHGHMTRHHIFMGLRAMADMMYYNMDNP